jgi:hypothetical protein
MAASCQWMSLRRFPPCRPAEFADSASNPIRVIPKPPIRMMKTTPRIVACWMLAIHSCLSGDEPRLNHFQAIGSHNSYHLAPPAKVLSAMSQLPKEAAEAWNYSHPPLVRQLGEVGLRQIELDVYADSHGALFANPLGVKLANLAGANLPDFDLDGVMKKPGFKILHIPDIDCWSNTPTLDSALAELSAWSAAQPDHWLVMVLIECKDRHHPPLPTRPEPFTRERLMELDAAIRKGIPREKLILPDDVRNGHQSLRQAIMNHGWPTIKSARGKFMFALDNTDAIRTRYLEGNTSLENRVLFVSAPDSHHPVAAWFKCNDPVGQFEKIQRLVRAGFLVRTRADQTKPDPQQRNRAFASGAHWISSDHFSSSLPPATRVVFPDGSMVRRNPLHGERP